MTIEPESHEIGRIDLAQALRTLRRASGLSGERLGDKTGMSESKISKIETGKLDRQQVLYGRGKRFTFLYTEAALRWRLVAPAAMAEQLDKVASVAELPTVSVVVIPLERTVPDCPLEVCTIYDDRLVGIETSAATIALRDKQDITYYRRMFDFLSSHALKGEEARDFIRAIAEEFRSSEQNE